MCIMISKGGARLEVQYHETPTISQICIRRETVEDIAIQQRNMCAMRICFICKQTTNEKEKRIQCSKLNLSQIVTGNII